jgi:hypothetical protein
MYGFYFCSVEAPRRSPETLSFISSPAAIFRSKIVGRGVDWITSTSCKEGDDTVRLRPIKKVNRKAAVFKGHNIFVRGGSENCKKNRPFSGPQKTWREK